MSGKYRSKGFFEFDILERGKPRHIKSVTIGERVVQRCLCDYALVPVISRTFIYDNGASMKDKGYSFAIRRLTQHLHEHYRKHGQDGYVLLFDFSKFFDHVNHALIKSILYKEFSDERLLALTEHFVDAFGDVGLGLGSQISQVLALASANRLDHVIKEVLRIRGYGRYMDDGYLIHHSKAYLRHCLNVIKAICDELGIVLNVKKTHIVKLSHGFTQLKVKWHLTNTGKVLRRICPKCVTVERRKLKVLNQKVLNGAMVKADVYQSQQSQESHARQFNAHRSVQNMRQLYMTLFQPLSIVN